MRRDQVALMVAPPHLKDKWQREIESLSRQVYVQKLDRHEDIKALMTKAAQMGPGIAKIGLVKRDMTKLGAARDAAVVWRNKITRLWNCREAVPEGYEPHQRLQKQRVATAPPAAPLTPRNIKGQRTTPAKNGLKTGSAQANCVKLRWC